MIGNDKLIPEKHFDSFVTKSKEILYSYLNEIGLVIYSHRASLTHRNPVLFYGVNPGQDPKIRHHTHWSIDKSLTEFASGCPSLITDQAWPKRKIIDGAYVRDYKSGQSPYQRRTQHLLNEIGHPNALVTNLLFLQSRSIQDLGRMHRRDDSEKLLASCWQVHELILEICSPDVIITCSTAVDRCLREKCDLREETRFPAMHVLSNGQGKDRECTVFKGRWKSRALTVLEIPHMSYYDTTNPARKAVLERIRGIVDAATRDSGSPVVPAQEPSSVLSRVLT